MKTIFSGIQPSGDLHLGNYIGAILQWKKMIEESKNSQMLFMIADLHALTTVKNGEKLQNDIISLMVTLIACGIKNSDNIKIFLQSKILYHAQLSWILSTIAPLGHLSRMTQFKDKSKNSNENINSGLLFYPILQAADILLYDVDEVPVGQDQKQHIEFTRDIAEKFHNEYNCEIFKLPIPIIKKEGQRVMSLIDGTKKMSKSDSFDNGKINLIDSNDQIMKKIKSAKTDSISGIFYDKINRPEISNLIEIMAIISNQSINQISEKYQSLSTKIFKDDLIEILINCISPIRNEINKLQNDQKFILDQFQEANEFANTIAEKTMKKVNKIIGIF